MVPCRGLLHQATASGVEQDICFWCDLVRKRKVVVVSWGVATCHIAALAPQLCQCPALWDSQHGQMGFVLFTREVSMCFVPMSLP